MRLKHLGDTQCLVDDATHLKHTRLLRKQEDQEETSFVKVKSVKCCHFHGSHGACLLDDSLIRMNLLHVVEASACSRFNFSNAKFAFIGKMQSIRNNLGNASIDRGNLSLCICSYPCDLKMQRGRGKQCFPIVSNVNCCLFETCGFKQQGQEF